MEHRVSNCGKTAHILTLHNHQNASVILTLHFQQSCTLEFFFLNHSTNGYSKWVYQARLPSQKEFIFPCQIHVSWKKSSVSRFSKHPDEPRSDHMDGFITAVMWLEKGEREQKDLGGGGERPFIPRLDNHWTKRKKRKMIKRQVTPVSIYSVGKIRFPLL